MDEWMDRWMISVHFYQAVRVVWITKNDSTADANG